MKISMVRGLVVVAVVVGVVSLAGCGKNAEDLGQKTGAALDKAAEKTTEVAKETATATKDVAGQVVEKTGEVMEKTGAAVEKTGANMKQ